MAPTGAVEGLRYEAGSLMPLKKGDEEPLVEHVQRRMTEPGFAYGLSDGDYRLLATDDIGWLYENSETEFPTVIS